MFVKLYGGGFESGRYVNSSYIVGVESVDPNYHVQPPEGMKTLVSIDPGAVWGDGRTLLFSPLSPEDLIGQINTTPKPYPRVSDSGIDHSLVWEDHYSNWQTTDVPNYEVGLILRPKGTHTGYCTVYRVRGDEVHLVTDYGNRVEKTVDEVYDSYTVTGICTDVGDHIKHQINKLSQFLCEGGMVL